MDSKGWTTIVATCLSVVLLAWFLADRVLPGGDAPERLSDPVTLKIAVGSELDDVLCAGGTSKAEESTATPVSCEPSELVDELQAETNVRLEPTFIGTLEAADAIVADPERFDAAWFASDDYLRLALAAKGTDDLTSSAPIMRSPVALGVRHDVATRLGWSEETPVSWKEIARSAGDGELGFLMTSPASSNSGLSTLAGVATAFDTEPPLQSEDVGQVQADVRQLFSGQLGRAASSGWLSDKFRENPTAYDAIFNYESELLTLSEQVDDLDIVYPSDGAAEATYPLTLIDAEKQQAYETAVAWLRTAEVQRELSETSGRRPGRTSVTASPGVPDNDVKTLPLPDDLGTIDELIFTYFDEFSPKTRTTYLLDTSASMDAIKMNQLRRAFEGLAGDDASISGQFKRFRKGERLAVYTYADRVKRLGSVVVEDQPDTDDALRGLIDRVGDLAGDGATAYYDAIDAAYADIKAAPEEGATTSIVLMTDGEQNGGQSHAQLSKKYESAYRDLGVPLYVVRVGDAATSDDQSIEQLVSFAEHTGGREVVAKDAADLRKIFQEIRDYQ
ncbi:Ca-activated chloride channel family protein [Nocardioides albertanoniae]|uniref:Ca-activated chloride channel family protein n=1 Tax=Nocardioides albertanoniae TaxID=1175486 RepID=A0A543A6K1_9ACTN|nr:VWA domain-containing protein [Nocardioides albertanoniae]TQL68233.1 Ca-activated chloride channel family protein [Nocardioides albertanoniae]